MKTSIVIDVSPPIKYLAKFCFSSYGQKCCWPIELPVSLKCNNISRKKWIVKFIFSTQRNIEIFYKLLLAFWVCVSRHAQSTQNKKCIYLQYLHENHRLKWFLCQQINMKVFCKVIVFWMYVTRFVQSTQNNKFEISLQYLKDNEKNEVEFLLVDKHQRFLQIDTIILGVSGQVCPNYLK